MTDLDATIAYAADTPPEDTHSWLVVADRLRESGEWTWPVILDLIKRNFWQ